MNHNYNNIFSLGKKSYKKSFEKELHPMDASSRTDRLKKEAIGKSAYSPNFTTHYNDNKNVVNHALKKVRGGGTVAPKKSNVYPR